MKKTILSFALLAAVVACEQENRPVQGTEPSQDRHEVTIVANASETKTLLSDDDAVLWESGDAIRLRFTSDDAVHTEDFTTADALAVATFSGSIPNDVTTDAGYSDDVYAVYPSTAMVSDGTVSFEIPASQTVAAGSFPTDRNLSSAKLSLDNINGAEATEATFLNALSIIRFTLPADVKSLKIIGDAALAGTAVMDFDADGRLAAESWTAESESVTLTPASGTSFTADATYNILVYPGTHSAITVELTDTDDCSYSKTVTKDFVFEAAKYYTFNFNTSFGKDFDFTVTGVTIPDNDKVRAVFGDYALEAVVTDNAFSIRLPHEVSADAGYAVYPTMAYSDGAVKYTLTATETPAALYTAALVLGTPVTTFNSVNSALSTMKFTVPAGVAKVQVTSSVAFAGETVMTVGTDGKMTAGAGTVTSVTLDPATAGEVVLNVYPFSNATITVTLTDAANAVNTQTFEAQAVAAGAEFTLSLDQDIDFEKGGSFCNENFTSGGDTIEF